MAREIIVSLLASHRPVLGHGQAQAGLQGPVFAINHFRM